MLKYGSPIRSDFEFHQFSHISYLDRIEVFLKSDNILTYLTCYLIIYN